jgi:antitoxin CptB
MQPPAHLPAEPPDPADAHRRRRLLFRATHRGTKENDFLVGGFVTRRLDTLTADDLAALELMLDLPDPDLADWLSGRRPIPADLHPPPLVAMLVRIRAAARGEP